jgi:predicted nucleotidyltransferase
MGVYTATLKEWPEGEVDWPKQDICGHRPMKIRNLFRDFVAAKVGFADGTFHHPKRMDDAYVATALGIDAAAAAALVVCLRGCGYLKSDKDIPTPLGMGLAAARRRRRISRSKAETLLQRVLQCATEVNARQGARVTIATIDVFGSYLSKAPDLGDLDLLVMFAMPWDDLQPSDMGERDRITTRLSRLSVYVSCHGEFDWVADDAEKRRVFPEP